jgi:alpha-L-fucosidase
MKKLMFLISLVSLPLLAWGQKYEPTWKSLEQYECPAWYQDAKFGIFIHWGVYSVPGYSNEWYPRNMYMKDGSVYKHHRETYGTQEKFGYKDFIPMFRAEKFNADTWAEIFRKSGARYVVPVAEHHDGFAMYDTRMSEWNAANMGPKRDIIGELSQALRKQGMFFGLSSHRIEHWWFFNGGKNVPSDVQDPRFAGLYGPAMQEKDSLTPEFMNDWLLRCTELVDKYKPQVFWFDWWIEQKAMEPYRRTFAAYYYNQGEKWNNGGVVLNYKNESFPPSVAVYDIERGSSKATKKYPWQTDTSIGKRSWGYIRDEENKTPNSLIDDLIDIVSKNGNLLLNIGPKPDGTIPEEQVNILLEIGKWLNINGEGIYGTRPWKIAGEGPTENPDGGFGESKRSDYNDKDFRFTAKGNTVYLFCMDQPKDKKLSIKALSLDSDPTKPIRSIRLLGSEEPVKWKQKSDYLEIVTPKQMPCDHAICFKIEL